MIRGLRVRKIFVNQLSWKYPGLDALQANFSTTATLLDLNMRDGSGRVNLASFSPPVTLQPFSYNSSMKEFEKRKGKAVKEVEQTWSVLDESDETFEDVSACLRSSSYDDLCLIERQELKKLLKKVDGKSLQNDFNKYCEYFSLLSALKFSWKDIHVEDRRQLLSLMKTYGDVDNLDLVAAEKLIHGIRYFLTTNNPLGELDLDTRAFYEKLLTRILKERYAPSNTKSFAENESKGAELPLAYAIFTQLKVLRNARLSREELALLFRGIEDEWATGKMHEYMKCTTIFMLGDLSIHYRDVPTQLWTLMMNDMTKCINLVKPASLGSTLKGWYRMKYYWRDMSPALQHATLEAISKSLKNNRDSQGISNILLYLGDLGVDWNQNLTDVLQKELLNALRLQCKYFNEQGISNSLLGLSKMNIRRNQIPQDIQDRLVRTVETKYSELTEQSVSNIIHSFGKIGWKWTDLPVHAQEVLTDSLIFLLKRKPVFSILAVDSCLHGFILLNFDWKKDHELQSSVLRIIEKTFRAGKSVADNASLIPALIYGLGKTSVDWKQLDPRTIQSLRNGIHSYLRECRLSPKAVSNLIYGLGKMEITVQEIPKDFQEDLESAIIKIEKMKYNSQDISNIIYSFSKMKYLWKDLTPQTTDSLNRMIRKVMEEFNPPGLSNLMTSLVRMHDSASTSNGNDSYIKLQQSLFRHYIDLKKGQDYFPRERNEIAFYQVWLQSLPASLSASFPSLHEIQKSQSKESKGGTKNH